MKPILTTITAYIHYHIRIYSVGVWNIIWQEPPFGGLRLEFTPLEFETLLREYKSNTFLAIRIYSVGVWNAFLAKAQRSPTSIRIYSVGVWNTAVKKPLNTSVTGLEFTPLEFETKLNQYEFRRQELLEFTPLEFETDLACCTATDKTIRIYSVGVWNQILLRLSFYH